MKMSKKNIFIVLIIGLTNTATKSAQMGTFFERYMGTINTRLEEILKERNFNINAGNVFEALRQEVIADLRDKNILSRPTKEQLATINDAVKKFIASKEQQPKEEPKAQYPQQKPQTPAIAKEMAHINATTVSQQDYLKTLEAIIYEEEKKLNKTPFQDQILEYSQELLDKTLNRIKKDLEKLLFDTIVIRRVNAEFSY